VYTTGPVKNWGRSDDGLLEVSAGWFSAALATNWQVFPDMSVVEFRRWVEIRVEALNHALRGIRPERVRVQCVGAAFTTRTKRTSRWTR
jgi:hypothetical protein